MSEDGAILAYVARLLREERRRARSNGAVWSPNLESAYLLTARDRLAPTLEDIPADPLDGRLVLTYEAVAKRLSVSKRTVERLVARRELPSVDVGGAVRVRATDLASYVDGLSMRGEAGGQETPEAAAEGGPRRRRGARQAGRPLRAVNP